MPDTHQTTFLPPEQEQPLLNAHPYLLHLPGFLLLSCGQVWVSPSLKATYPELGEDFSLQKLTRFLPEHQRSSFQSLLSDRYRLLAATFDQKIPLEPPLDNTILGIRQLFYQGSPNWLGILFSTQKTDRPQHEIQPAPPLLPADFERLEHSQNIGFWQFDLQNRQVYFSNAIYHILGYEPGELSTPLELIAPDDYHLMRVIVEAMVQSPPTPNHRVEVKYRHKSGRLTPILFTIQPHGPKYMGTYQSVEEPVALRNTLRQVTEEAEQRSKRFKVLFDTLPEMVFIADAATGIILNCNQAVKPKLGYEPKELIGQHHTIIYPEATREQVNNAYRKGKKPGPLQVIPLRTKEGEIIETQPSETVIDYNGIRARLGIFSDKTKLVRAEQKAERRQRQYRQLVKHSSDLITISNRDLTVQWASNNTKAILGYAKSELQGSKLLDLIHPEDLKPATDLILNALQEDEPEFSYTARFWHKDNSYRWLQNHIIRTTDDAGQPIGITYSRDITAQMELQEKRAEMDRLKQEFVSMASHQLRTPMAVFAANLEMLAETEEAKSPLMKRILARMERESTRMVRLVDDVLAVSRLNTEEELQVNKTPIEIVSFLREIVADEAFYFDEVPIALHTELQQGTVEADEEQLTHILHNLLSNAIKYSERRAPPEVHVRQTAAGKIQVDLKDHGVGIPEADLPKLFQQFHRASNVKKIAGTGLGLYIAKRFAEANAIEIEVDSKEDIGTTFSLTFNQTGHAQTH